MEKELIFLFFCLAFLFAMSGASAFEQSSCLFPVNISGSMNYSAALIVQNISRLNITTLRNTTFNDTKSSFSSIQNYTNIFSDSYSFSVGNDTFLVYANNTVAILEGVNCDSTINYTVQDQNYSLGSDIYGYVYVPMQNNRDNIVNLSVSSNSSVLKPVSDFVYLMPKSSILFPLLYNTSGILGNNSYKLQVGNVTALISIKVTDQEPPQIKNIVIPDSSSALTPVEIQLEATDNKEVAYVSISAEDGDSVNMSLVDKNKYSTKIKVYSTGSKAVTITAYDSSGNHLSVTRKLDIRRLGGIETFPYQPVQLAMGYTYRQKVIFSEYQIPNISVTLERVENYPANTTATYSFDGDGIPYSEIKPNQTMVFNNFRGNLYFSVRFENGERYKGSLIFALPNSVDDAKQVDFSGVLGTLTIYAERTVPFGEKVVNCKVNNTGFIDTTDYVCTFHMPVSSQLNNALIPLTENEYNAIKAKVRTELLMCNNNLEWTTTKYYIFLGAFILILISLSALYFYEFSGRRVKWRGF